MSTNRGTMTIHAFLGITPEEVDTGLLRRGLDPSIEVASLRRLGAVLAAQFGPQAQREQAQPPAMSKLFPIYEEAVAAGAPAWTGSASSQRQASIIDIVDQSDPATTILVPVSGWSMRDDGINDGDMVLVDTKREARDGDTVVAHIAGEGQVVKRIRMAPGGPITLESANCDFAPRVIEDASNLRIHGVVVGRAGRI